MTEIAEEYIKRHEELREKLNIALSKMESINVSLGVDKIAETKNPFQGLSARVSNCLRIYGFKTREQVEFIAKNNGDLLLQMNSYGPKSHRELRDWLELLPDKSEVEYLLKRADYFKRRAERFRRKS